MEPAEAAVSVEECARAPSQKSGGEGRADDGKAEFPPVRHDHTSIERQCGEVSSGEKGTWNEFMALDKQRSLFNKMQILFWQIQDSVLTKWVNDPHRMDKRTLSLIFLAHASDVLENAFAPLNDEDYELAMRRVRELLDLDYENASKASTQEIMWAIFMSFTK